MTKEKLIEELHQMLGKIAQEVAELDEQDIDFDSIELSGYKRAVTRTMVWLATNSGHFNGSIDDLIRDYERYMV